MQVKKKAVNQQTKTPKQKKLLDKHMTTRKRLPKVKYNTNRRRNAFMAIFNKKFGWLALGELSKDGWSVTKQEDRRGKIILTKGDVTGTFGNTFIVDGIIIADGSMVGFAPGEYYYPFEVVTILKFKGLKQSTVEWFANNYDAFPEADNYIRVGNKYYKLVTNKDRYGIEREERLERNVSLIERDFSGLFVEAIPAYDKFIIEPENIDHRYDVRGNYNMYAPMAHSPKKGSYEHSLAFVEHIFGDDFELGLDYLQLLYVKPKQLLPVLLLLSKEKNTGKTTVLKWLKVIFGANAGTIRPEDLNTQFNASYATKNIALIDEAKFKGDEVFEKLKSLTTSDYVSMEMKGIEVTEVDYFGKWIIAGNDEEGIIRMDSDEIRYWPRILPELKIDDPDFLREKLIPEIPAFLWFLKNRKLKTKRKMGRHYLDPELLKSPALEVLKANSIPNAAKDITIAISEAIDNLIYLKSEFDSLANAARDNINISDEVRKKDKNVVGLTYGSLTDLERLMGNKYSRSRLKKVLRGHFGLSDAPLQQRKYRPFAEVLFDGAHKNWTGKPIIFIKYKDDSISCDLIG